jgi:hypothetical protein
MLSQVSGSEGDRDLFAPFEASRVLGAEQGDCEDQLYELPGDCSETLSVLPPWARPRQVAAAR